MSREKLGRELETLRGRLSEQARYKEKHAAFDRKFPPHAGSRWAKGNAEDRGREERERLQVRISELEKKLR